MKATRQRIIFFMRIASVSATGKTARFILVSDVFISRERKCRSGVHPMTFAHNHSRTFQYRFFILPGTFIRWNTWEVRNEYSRINGIRNFLPSSIFNALNFSRVAKNTQKKEEKCIKCEKSHIRVKKLNREKTRR